ncbi:MBL fold metallo-hydrolase [Heyndrickxia coagulans]|uniref:MBL fold metallo-hydrolase n=1 Tax=Heyndrickxia coagulans TaxID=1398 RepID=A0AAW7CG23_HEYCO|nr:MBL fold metallo-hydrolase [Heyndrickxia coagulans]MDL5039866.1 MBL fold metallo-hydrolase [Heyndrickxia coagulans]
MAYTKFGPLTVIPGENGSRVPFSTSLLVEGGQGAALVDCGSGFQILNEIKKEYTIRSVYLTHYHLDHIWGAYLFKDAEIQINPYDVKKLNDVEELAKASGMLSPSDPESRKKWMKQLFEKPPENWNRPHWQPVLNLTEKWYPYGEELNVYGTKMLMIHAPGHTEGYCCPYFPEHGVLFAGDFDLASFGPWYNNADSDIDAFIASAKTTLETDAQIFITSHHKGVVDRKTYEELLKRYINKIYEREEKTRSAVKRGVAPDEMIYEEIFYFRKNLEQNPQLVISEIVGIAKHLDRLVRNGEPFEAYFEAFLQHFQLTRENIFYHTSSVPAQLQ